MAVAGSGSFYITFTGNEVLLEQASWNNVDIAAVRNVVDTTPEVLPTLTAKDALLALPLELRALLDVLRDLINTERSRHGAPLISKKDLLDLIEAKISVLGS